VSTRQLQEFLCGPDVPRGTLGFHQLQGFLFALASAPELVQPSEWLPIVFGGQMPTPSKMTQVQPMMGSLMELYNEINGDVVERGGRLPADCAFRPDTLSNLEPDAPISQWSRGFIDGHTWLQETWNAALPEEDDDEVNRELAAVLMTLSFFASRQGAQHFLEECARPGTTLDEMAQLTRQTFSEAAAAYAELGRMIYEASLKE
jgi:uncharacterized protein